jgi:hypothetical protein
VPQQVPRRNTATLDVRVEPAVKDHDVGLVREPALLPVGPWAQEGRRAGAGAPDNVVARALEGRAQPLGLASGFACNHQHALHLVRSMTAANRRDIRTHYRASPEQAPCQTTMSRPLPHNNQVFDHRRHGIDALVEHRREEGESRSMPKTSWVRSFEPIENPSK